MRESNNADYYPNMIDEKSQKSIVDMITARWVQGFMNQYHIVSRAKTGKLMVSTTKQAQIE